MKSKQSKVTWGIHRASRDGGCVGGMSHSEEEKDDFIPAFLSLMQTRSWYSVCFYAFDVHKTHSKIDHWDILFDHTLNIYQWLVVLFLLPFHPNSGAHSQQKYKTRGALRDGGCQNSYLSNQRPTGGILSVIPFPSLRSLPRRRKTFFFFAISPATVISQRADN